MNEGLFYIEHYFTGRNVTAYWSNKQVLQAIIDTETVWKIPTNLFSFFYGLPDSPKELRALLEGAQDPWDQANTNDVDDSNRF